MSLLKSSGIDFQISIKLDLGGSPEITSKFTFEIKLHLEIFLSDPPRNHLQPYPENQCSLICPFEVNIHFSMRVNQVWEVIFPL